MLKLFNNDLERLAQTRLCPKQHTDPCHFIKLTVFIVIFVDDGAIAAVSQKEIVELISSLKRLGFVLEGSVRSWASVSPAVATASNFPSPD